MSEVIVEISQGIATVTLNRPKSLNAITVEDYDAFANALRDIDRRDDVLVTVWQATGKWFCAGTNVKGARPFVSGSLRNSFLNNVAHTTTDCGQALYSHSKILVAALNGPVMGISAALLGHFDFIYSVPEAWLSVPFTFLGQSIEGLVATVLSDGVHLGIVAEGGASVTFANRMGVAKANEALFWGKKQTAEELVRCGFINKIFPSSTADKFHAAVRRHLQSELEGLDPTALLSVKKLLRAGLDEKNNPDAVNLRESYAQSERFASGIPAERFGQIARREIRHKL